jgi:hypothetical protein
MFMETDSLPNGLAPARSIGVNKGGSFQLGAKGGRTALAWQYVWDRLDRTEWRYGLTLAEEAANEYGLKLVSVIELLSRMRASGAIEQKMIAVPTTYVRYGKPFTAQRKRVHYRIAGDQ